METPFKILKSLGSMGCHNITSFGRQIFLFGLFKFFYALALAPSSRDGAKNRTQCKRMSSSAQVEHGKLLGPVVSVWINSGSAESSSVAMMYLEAHKIAEITESEYLKILEWKME
ncbi:hypothetical protein NQ317_012845 [Molorchus minor]|uniref:Uncharacterized protein n=1 Tax=Molorchus minor TaxID=1323400 RepID=A0ABQ9ITJ9_9CUCU|nr:hypothetical protein NQ317_012845 [Molorchus minor]